MFISKKEWVLDQMEKLEMSDPLWDEKVKLFCEVLDGKWFAVSTPNLLNQLIEQDLVEGNDTLDR